MNRKHLKEMDLPRDIMVSVLVILLVVDEVVPARLD
jgi:hypothetical protein